MTDRLGQLQAALEGHYTIERELGRGGMATVYLARDLRHARPVALKVLHGMLAEVVGPERFQREIRLAAGFQHPHILTVHDSGEAAGQLWFTMPFVEGESLRDRLSREKQLPLDDALRIAREVADALDYAHRRGVVHRDIKPENILLSGSHALVADFGIARALAPDAERLTETGLAVGTAAYMSPEQAAGERDLDGRTDVYSLATVLYEMLAGQTPFQAPTAQALIARRFTETPVPVTAARDTVPPDVADAVQRGLARIPADRFATAGDFARALSVSAAVPAAPRTRRTPWTRTPWPRVALFVAVPIAVIAAIAIILARRNPTAGHSAGPRLLAVLPFENVGAPGDQYFADGVTDAVRGKLTAIPGLRVIASASSGAYRGSTKSLSDIARELGVTWLLVGKVRWARQPDGTSRVQVSPELIDAASKALAWQQPFDATLTDVFQVQADIARKVAEALDVALGDSARTELAARPTANLAAYDAFLRGEEVSTHGAAGDPASLRQAASLYAEATELDPAFGLAWARFAEMHARLFGLLDPRPESAEAARMASERAVSLAPRSPEAWSARAIYYQFVPRDIPRAAEAVAQGLRLAPDDATLLTTAGAVEMSLGRWDSAVVHLERASTIDPRSPATARKRAYALVATRQYAAARPVLDQALAIAPSDLALRLDRVTIELAEGRLDSARAILRQTPSTVSPTAMVAFVATWDDLYWILDDAQQQLVLRLGVADFDGNQASRLVVIAETRWVRGDSAGARIYADSAQAAYARQAAATPNDPQVHLFRGLSLAYLGRKAEAIREAERGAALLPLSKDADYGGYMQHQLMRVYIVTGEHAKALDILERLLSIPYLMTPAWTRIDPNFAPLRGEARFQRITG